VSREEAHRPIGARPRSPDEPARPKFPLFTAGTDEIAGVIRTRGHVDAVGADDLCRAITALQRLGHRQIAVQLGQATVLDDDAHAFLAEYARHLGTDGVCLRIADDP
jgi:hypothetical protein